MKLRWYQEQAADAACLNIGKVKKQVICLPTGSGKSVVIAEIAKRFFTENNFKKRVLMVTHRKELVAQNAEKIRSIMKPAPVGVLSAGLKKFELGAPILYAGVQTIYKRIEKNPEIIKGVGLVLIDEAHMKSPNEDSVYSKLFKTIEEMNPDATFIGLTATPFRMNCGRIIGEGMFDEVVYDISGREGMGRLVSEGVLSALVTESSALSIDRETLQDGVSDFTESSMNREFKRKDEKIINDFLLKLKQNNRKKVIVFASGIEHITRVESIIKSHGVECLSVHSKMKAIDADENINTFKHADSGILISADKLTTGFDVPDIDAIICLRPTKSAALWVQMLGRGTRVYEGKKNCLVIDYSKNTEELGPIDNPNEPQRKREAGTGVLSLPKMCPQCSEENAAQARFCRYCKFEFYKVDKWKNLSTKASGLDVMARTKISILKIKRIFFKPYTSKSGRQMTRAEIETYEAKFFSHFIFSDKELDFLKATKPKFVKIDESGKYIKVVEFL